MIYFKDTMEFSLPQGTCAVLTIGKFDGLHMGHKKLLDEVMRQKKEKNLKTVIFTFDTSPQSMITHTKPHFLTTNEEKHLVFESIGIDYFIECPFTEEVREIEAEDFIRMTVEKLHVSQFVVGTDCSFGHNRSGNAKVLEHFASKYGYGVSIVEKKQYEGRDISSTFVREEIEKGNIEKANLLLGYPYFFHGEVKMGNRIGNTIGFPTLNIYPDPEKMLPPFGVYASSVIIGDRCYDSVTNIGIRPTIEGKHNVSIETNVFGYSGNAYGEMVTLRLFHFLRPEQKFGSLEELKQQIAIDSGKAKEIMEGYHTKPEILYNCYV
jgi:riboflavin kinase/FMN adenylyltransferase